MHDILEGVAQLELKLLVRHCVDHKYFTTQVAVRIVFFDYGSSEMPTIIIGPMVRTWTMRHEAKLSMFKLAAHLGNFKNIALTLAQRYQRWMCYQSASGELLRPNFECGPGDQQTLGDMAASVIECIRNAIPNINNDTFVFHPTWVKKDGIKYHKNNCYIITGSDGTDPIIA